MASKRKGQGKDKGISRRGFLGTGAVAGVALSTKEAQAAKTKTLGPKKVGITLEVNGKKQNLQVEPRTTLLRALRNQLDLTGTKEVCNGGACGACSVQLDGKLVNSCMVFAVDAAGRKVATIEGLSNGDKLHPIQTAFVKYDALQCGFCTPGMVMACKAILDKHKTPTLHQIKRGLAGNICRCGTYTRIFQAVQAAAKEA